MCSAFQDRTENLRKLRLQSLWTLGRAEIFLLEYSRQFLVKHFPNSSIVPCCCWLKLTCKKNKKSEKIQARHSNASYLKMNEVNRLTEYRTLTSWNDNELPCPTLEKWLLYVCSIPKNQNSHFSPYAFAVEHYSIRRFQPIRNQQFKQLHQQNKRYFSYVEKK